MARLRHIMIALLLTAFASTTTSALASPNAKGGGEEDPSGGCFNCIIQENGGHVWHQDVYWIYTDKWRDEYHSSDTYGYCSDFHTYYSNRSAPAPDFLDTRDAVLVSLIRSEKAVLNASRGAIQLLDETRQHVVMHRAIDSAQLARLEEAVSGEKSP